MMMSTDRERLRYLLQSVLGIETISEHGRQDDYVEWDSLAYMSVVARVEDEFDVEVTAENIEAFGSIDTILKEIEKTRNT